MRKKEIILISFLCGFGIGKLLGFPYNVIIGSWILTAILIAPYRFRR
jgi:hypothetical protein